MLIQKPLMTVLVSKACILSYNMNLVITLFLFRFEVRLAYLSYIEVFLERVQYFV